MFSGLSQRIIEKLFILMLSAGGSLSAKTGDAGLRVQSIKIKRGVNTTCINLCHAVHLICLAAYLLSACSAGSCLPAGAPRYALEKERCGICAK